MITAIPVSLLTAHPKNPRIEARQDVVDQIAAQITAKGYFDEAHALIVRNINDTYQIISGHHRWLAAKQANLSEVPCFIRDMSDEQAYMDLVLCNTQSELHPLEEGKHAAESGMDLKAYAIDAMRNEKTLHTKVRAFRVLSTSNLHVEIFGKSIRDQWRNLAEIHAAPRWLWSALVSKMVEGEWTVATTRQMVGNYKEALQPPDWCDEKGIAESLLKGLISIHELKQFSLYPEKETLDDDLKQGMYAALKKLKPRVLSVVQKEVNEWVSKQQARNLEAQQAEVARQQTKERIAWLRKNCSLSEWEQLPQEGKESLLIPLANEGGTFNKQESADIEWAQWSWNPVTGCRHGCSYCYARDIAISRKMEKVYPNGFEATFRSNALNDPINTKVPEIAATDARYRNVFTCSMADLFGRWVPIEWINAVMQSVRNNPQWTFLFLTKFPNRYAEIEVPENAWLGTTVDLQARVANAEKAFSKVKSAVKWLSIEPMIEPITFNNIELFDWVVIGGASASSQTPKWQPPYRWIEALVKQCDDANIPVYFKSNLGIANRILRLPFDAPVTQEPQAAPESFRYLGARE